METFTVVDEVRYEFKLRAKDKEDALDKLLDERPKMLKMVLVDTSFKTYLNGEEV